MPNSELDIPFLWLDQGLCELTPSPSLGAARYILVSQNGKNLDGSPLRTIVESPPLKF